MEKKTAQEQLDYIVKTLEQQGTMNPDKQCEDIFNNRAISKSVAKNPANKPKVKPVFQLSEKAYLKFAAAILSVVMMVSAVTITIKEINYNNALNEALNNSDLSIAICQMIDDEREASPNLQYAEKINVDFDIESTLNVVSYIKEHPEKADYAIYCAYKRYARESSFGDSEIRTCMNRLMRELKESTKDSENPFVYDTHAAYVSSLGFNDSEGNAEFKKYDKALGNNFTKDYEAEKELSEIQSGGLAQ